MVLGACPYRMFSHLSAALTFNGIRYILNLIFLMDFSLFFDIFFLLILISKLIIVLFHVNMIKSKEYFVFNFPNKYKIYQNKKYDKMLTMIPVRVVKFEIPKLHLNYSYIQQLLNISFFLLHYIHTSIR